MDELKKEKLQLEVVQEEEDVEDFVLAFPGKRRYFLVGLIVMIIPIYFVAKYSTAAVYLLNFEKRAIVAHEAKVSSLPIQILSVRALSILGNNYSAYALIKNPNKELIASSLTYQFHFYGQNGQELASDESGGTYILGGEQKYIIEPNVKLSEPPSKVEVEIKNPVWKKRLNIPNIIVRSGIPQFGDQDTPQGFYIQDSLTNSSVYNLGTVIVNAVVMNKSGEVIAVTKYVANDVKPDETREYKMFWPLPIAGNVQGTPQITVEANPFDPNNLK